MAAGSKAAGGGRSPRAQARKRGSAAAPAARTRLSGSTAGSMLQFYTGDDSPGKQIGPVPVLVMSLLFIAVVFMLHIWGKYMRS